MKKLLIVLLATAVTSTVWAHNGQDPVKDLEKNNHRLLTKQAEFSQLDTPEDRIENLESQTKYLQKNIYLLRNLMAKDYPHIKAKMSKYELDYMEEIRDNLSKFKVAIKQMKTTMP
jgi:hypothetical protein